MNFYSRCFYDMRFTLSAVFLLEQFVKTYLLLRISLLYFAATSSPFRVYKYMNRTENMNIQHIFMNLSWAKFHQYRELGFNQNVHYAPPVSFFP